MCSAPGDQELNIATCGKAARIQEGVDNVWSTKRPETNVHVALNYKEMHYNLNVDNTAYQHWESWAQEYIKSVARNGQVKAELVRLNSAAQHHKAAETAAQDVTGAVLIYLLHILLLIFWDTKKRSL